MKTLNTNELEALCQSAKQAAIAAGQYIQSQFDEHYEKHQKEGGDSLASQVVTAVDMKAQQIILELLQDSVQIYDLGLLTEELVDDHSRAEKSYFWCIDPMDGTLPFTEHRTGYAVSIALISNAGDPVIGVVYIPDMEACYTSIKERGVQLNDLPFSRQEQSHDTLHLYMDQSFLSMSYYDLTLSNFNEYAKTNAGLTIEYHTDFGGVRNAIGVMSTGKACYFKFPKKGKGCGSIWDYAATRLFFEEIGLHIFNAQGDRLHLNNLETTFMNDQGILYATDEELVDFIISIGEQVQL